MALNPARKRKASRLSGGASWVRALLQRQGEQRQRGRRLRAGDSKRRRGAGAGMRAGRIHINIGNVEHSGVQTGSPSAS